MSATEAKFWKCPTHSGRDALGAGVVHANEGCKDKAEAFELGFTSGVSRACQWCETNLAGSGDKAAVAASVVTALENTPRGSDEQAAYDAALKFVTEALT